MNKVTFCCNFLCDRDRAPETFFFGTCMLPAIPMFQASRCVLSASQPHSRRAVEREGKRQSQAVFPCTAFALSARSMFGGIGTRHTTNICSRRVAFGILILVRSEERRASARDVPDFTYCRHNTYLSLLYRTRTLICSAPSVHDVSHAGKGKKKKTFLFLHYVLLLVGHTSNSINDSRPMEYFLW